MCAMDRVAHFPMGHLAPPPWVRLPPLPRKNWLTRVQRCRSIGSTPEAQGPMSVCQLRDLATKKGVETLPRRARTYPKTIYAARGLCGRA